MVDWEYFWKSDKNAFTKSSQKRLLKIEKMLQKVIEKNDYKTFADIGCGNGFLLKILAKRFPKIQFVGYDISKHIIKENKKSQLNNIEFSVADYNKMKGKKHDLIFLSGVLQHELYPLKKIKYLMNFLNYKGSLVADFPNKESFQKKKKLHKKLSESERKYWETRTKLMYQGKNFITFNQIKDLGHPCKVIMKNPIIIQIKKVKKS